VLDERRAELQALLLIDALEHLVPGLMPDPGSP